MGGRLVLVMACLGCALTVQAAQGPAADRPVVVLAEIDGIIHPISAEFVADVIARADAAQAGLVVLVLRTPGGLLDSTRSIVSRMMTSRAPVAVFVEPSGARAASAGFIILLAADVAAMAPGTHAGAAHPVSGTGQGIDDAVSQKVASDTAAYLRSIAAARGRNVALASEGVLRSRAFTDREALHAQPALIDFAASSLDDLLRQLDGRTVKRFDGRSQMVSTAGAEIRRVEMTRRQRFLSALAHPQVAYLLMMLGILGLSIELWNPGAIAPGVAGGVCLLLAFFAFQILPVNLTGLLLVAFGIGLLVLELKVPGFGALAIGGTISLVVGSVMLTESVPGVRVGLGVLIPVAVGLAAPFLILGRLALKAQRLPSTTGVADLVGRTGRVRTLLTPGAPGHVDVRGEIWRAVSGAPLQPGNFIRVTDVSGLTLVVEPADATHDEGDRAWKQ